MRSLNFPHSNILTAVVAFTTAITLTLAPIIDSAQSYDIHWITVVFLTFCVSFVVIYVLMIVNSNYTHSPIKDLAKEIDNYFRYSGSYDHEYRPSIVISILAGMILFVLFIYIPNS